MNILVDYRYRIVCCERTGIYFVGEIVLLQIAQEKEFCGHLARIHHTPRSVKLAQGIECPCRDAAKCV